MNPRGNWPQNDDELRRMLTWCLVQKEHRKQLLIEAESITYDLRVAEASRERIRRTVAY